MFLLATQENELNVNILDYWTFIHWMLGVTIFAVGRVSLKTCLIFALVWEIFENSSYGSILWKNLGEEKYDGDSIENIISDILAVGIGYKCAQIRD